MLTRLTYLNIHWPNTKHWFINNKNVNSTTPLFELSVTERRRKMSMLSNFLRIMEAFDKTRHYFIRRCFCFAMYRILTVAFIFSRPNSSLPVWDMWKECNIEGRVQLCLLSLSLRSQLGSSRNWTRTKTVVRLKYLPTLKSWTTEKTELDVIWRRRLTATLQPINRMWEDSMKKVNIDFCLFPFLHFSHATRCLHVENVNYTE